MPRSGILGRDQAWIQDTTTSKFKCLGLVYWVEIRPGSRIQDTSKFKCLGLVYWVEIRPGSKIQTSLKPGLKAGLEFLSLMPT